MLFSAFRRSAIGSLLGFALLRVSAAQAAAEKPAESINPLDLSWVTPDPSCAGAVVRTRALQLLPAGVVPRSLRARAELSRDGKEWLVQLETHSENNTGRRALRGSSCQEIQQAIALLLAMILEAESRSEQAPASPPETPTSSPAPAPPRPSPSPPDVVEPPPAPPPASRELGWLLRVEGVATYGVQPGIGLGIGGAVGATWNGFELGLGVSYSPVTREHALDGAATLEMSRENFALVGCYRLWRWGRFELIPCVAPGLSLVRWRSKGIDVPRYGRTGTQLNLGAALELRLRIFRPLFLALGPGLVWERSQAFMTGRGDNCVDRCQSVTFFEASALSPRLTLAIATSF